VQPLFHDPIYRLIATDLNVQPEDDVLDVGCGAGVFLAKYAAHARRIAGIDMASDRVAMACRRFADRIAAGEAQIVAGDAAALPWRDDTFSAVACMESLELLAEPESVLAEMRRVLRPGGRIAVTMGSRLTPRSVRLWRRQGWWVWSEDDVRRMMRDAGFGDVAMSYRSWAGNIPLLGPVSRVMFGTDEGRFVRATKPQVVHLEEQKPARETLQA
jgi:SAM-dependent methyltransferase